MVNNTSLEFARSFFFLIVRCFVSLPGRKEKAHPVGSF